MKKAQEFRSRGLSRQVAQTSFGKSLLVLLEKWGQLAAPAKDAAEAPVPDAVQQEAKQALERVLLSGLDGMAFSREHLVDLTLRLCCRDGRDCGPSAEIVEWLQGTPYFREYLAKDPAFGGILAGMLPQGERASERVTQEQS